MKPPKAKKNRKKMKKKGAAAASPPQGDSPPDGGDPPRENKEVETETTGGGGGAEEGEKALDWLIDAFSAFSLEAVRLALRDAEGDPWRAADILGASSAGSTMSESSISISSSSSSSSSSSMASSPPVRNAGGNRRRKKVAVSTGLVSDVIKGYGGAVSGGGGRRRDCDGRRECQNKRYTYEEAEEFLCSMLGGSCELDPAVVKDVFGHCGYDVEKTLDALLDMSASSNYQSIKSICDNYDKLNHVACPDEFVNGHHMDHIDKFQFMDNTSESTFHPYVKDHELLQSVGRDCRDHAKVQLRLLYDQTSAKPDAGNLDLQQKVLESLFNISDTSKKEPHCMNWKKALKKVESLSQGLEFYSTSITEQQQKLTNGKDYGYEVFRSVARQHWETMKSNYQKASIAYSKGERAHASYLSEKGKFYGKLAREADEKASLEIFEARNKDIRNAVTIDLHGQHIKQAIRLLKLHLLLFTYSPSIQFLRVITGSGTHGVRRGTLKQSVIGLVEKEGIEWSQENPGTVVLRIDGLKEYSFMTSDSDSE